MNDQGEPTRAKSRTGLMGRGMRDEGRGAEYG